MRSENIVIYALPGAHGDAKQARAVVYDVTARKPLLSIADGEDDAVFRVQHAVSACYRDAEQRGVPHPKIVAVREERESDENGKTVGKYTPLDARTLRAKPGAETVTELNDLFKENA